MDQFEFKKYSASNILFWYLDLNLFLFEVSLVIRNIGLAFLRVGEGLVLEED